MDVFVINLAESSQRRSLITNSLVSVGVRHSIHIASRGSLVDRSQYPGSDSLSDGELGCAISHYELYEKISGHPEKVFCILEDDVRPTKNLNKVLEYFEDNPPPDNVVVLLNAAFTHYHVIEITKRLAPKLKIGVIQALPGGLGSTGGYILSGSTAASLASARRTDWSFTADSWTHYNRCGALTKAWIILPYPTPPSFRSESTIGYSSNQTSLVQAMKNWPIFGPLRNLNRRRVWLSKQIPKRIVNHWIRGTSFHLISK